MKMMPFQILALTLLTMLLPSAALAQTASFQFYRFTVEKVRNVDGGLVFGGPQMSEFEFFLGDTEILGNPDIVVTDFNGNTGGNEGPQNLVDGDINTKWFLSNSIGQPLIFNFGRIVEIDSFSFVTGNDVEDRDPVQWVLEGSNNSSDWTLLDIREEDQDIPLARKASTEKFILNNIAFPPSVSFTISDGNVTTTSGVGVSAGTLVTLSWEATGATNTTLDTGSGPQTVTATGSTTVAANATTTYTFAATNGVGTTTATTTAFVGVAEMPLRLNEFVAEATLEEAVICDENGDPSDWIEIYNPNPYAVTIGGRFLTVDSSKADRWAFPTGTFIEAEDYLVVFASGKNRATAGSELHTDFTLGLASQYLGILATNGSTVQDELANYPDQTVDVAYGRTLSNSFNIFLEPTPGDMNTTPAGPLGPEVMVFSNGQPVESGINFVSSTNFSFSTSQPGAQIRFTVDGTVPTNSSPLYSGGQQLISSSTLVRARAFVTNFAPGPVASRGFVRLTPNVQSQMSDLPVIIVENFDGGSITSTVNFSNAWFSLFQPDSGGQTSLSSEPTLAGRVGIRKRGNAGEAKASYRIQFREGGVDDPLARNLFGFSTDSEWILRGPYSFDTSLIRIPFIHQLINDAGFYSQRTQLVELYLNTSGNVSFATPFDNAANDYQGVYVLQEVLKTNEERLAIEPLRKNDDTAGELNGGYVIRIDAPDPGDVGFRSTRDLPGMPDGNPRPVYNFEEPREQGSLQAQQDYIKAEIDAFETALYDGDASNLTTGYRGFMELDSIVDHSIFAILSQNPDALRLHTYLFKPRDGKLQFGPMTEVDRALSASNDRRSTFHNRWVPETDRANFFQYDWWLEFFKDLEFEQAWIDRWTELRQNELSNTSMQERIDTLAASVSSSQQRNFNRWPARTADNQQARLNNSQSGQDFSGGVPGWQGEVDHLKGFMTARADWIDSELVSPPEVTEGGLKVAGSSITLTPTEGVLWYRTDGQDPREVGGGIRAGSLQATSPTNFNLPAGVTTVIARSKDGPVLERFDTDWSGPVRRTYITSGTPATSENLVISEIMYNPAPGAAADPSDYEFLELRNISGGPISLAGVRISRAIEFDFPTDATIPANGTYLLVRSTSFFQNRYPGVTPDGEWGPEFDLNNAGERIIVTGIAGERIIDITYDDFRTEGWPQASDGAGNSLTIDLPVLNADGNEASTWRDSLSENGTPGESFNNYCDEWTDFYFPAGGADAANDADPDGDGLENLLELGLGLDPTVGSNQPAISSNIETLTIGANTSPYLTVTFTRRRNINGVMIQAVFSNSMEDSFPAEGFLVRSRDLGNGNEEVTYRDTTPFTNTRRFARVEVMK